MPRKKPLKNRPPGTRAKCKICFRVLIEGICPDCDDSFLDGNFDPLDEAFADDQDDWKGI